MRASEEQVQMEIRIGTPFVKLTFDKLGTQKTKTWLKVIWKNMESLEIELLCSDLPLLPL